MKMIFAIRCDLLLHLPCFIQSRKDTGPVKQFDSCDGGMLHLKKDIVPGLEPQKMADENTDDASMRTYDNGIGRVCHKTLGNADDSFLKISDFVPSGKSKVGIELSPSIDLTGKRLLDFPESH